VTFKPYLYLAVLLTVSSAADVRAQVNNDRAAAHLERAAQLAAHRDAKAEQEYRLAIHYRGGNFPEAWLDLSQFLKQHLRFSEAATALQNYLAQTDQKDLADDFEELAVLQRAANLKERIDKSKKATLGDYLELTTIVARYGENKDALPYAEKAVSSYPESSEALVAVARYLPPDQKARKSSVLQRAIELAPGNATAHALLGWDYFLVRGNAKEAAKQFNKALELTAGQYADAWEGLGRALIVQGEREAAAAAFRNYLRVRKTPSQYDGYIKQEIERLEREQ
jgi:Tetratricopeptide repeat